MGMSCAFAVIGAVILTVLMEITVYLDATHPCVFVGQGVNACPPDSGFGTIAFMMLILCVTIPLGVVLGILTATVIGFSRKSQYRKAAIYCFSIGASILLLALSCLFVLEFPEGIHFEVFWWPVNIWAIGMAVYGVIAVNRYRNDKSRGGMAQDQEDL